MICAFYDPSNRENPCHDLTLHSLRVGSLAAIISETRVTRNNPIFKYFIVRGCQLNPTSILIQSSILHDLGKASNYYQKYPEKGFVYHEHVASVILNRASDLSLQTGDVEAAHMLSLIAYIVSRHHVAMSNRHPDSLIKEKNNSVRIINRALNQFDSITLSQISLLQFLPQKTGKYIIESLSTKNWHPRVVKNYLYRNTTYNIVNNDFCEFGDPSVGYKLLKVIQLLAGILIVSDILVAWKERSQKDSGRIYAKSWLVELKIGKKLDEIILLGDAESLYNRYLGWKIEAFL